MDSDVDQGAVRVLTGNSAGNKSQTRQALAGEMQRRALEYSNGRDGALLNKDGCSSQSWEHLSASAYPVPSIGAMLAGVIPTIARGDDVLVVEHGSFPNPVEFGVRSRLLADYLGAASISPL